MKKFLIAVTIIFIVLASPILAVRAQENLASDTLSILILSPENRTYTGNSLVLHTQVEAKTNPQSLGETSRLVTYSLDGKANASTEDRYYGFSTYIQGSIAKYTATLKELPDGPHNVTVYVKYTTADKVLASNATAYFSIDTTQIPTPTQAYPAITPSPSPTSTSTLSPNPTQTANQPLSVKSSQNYLGLQIGIAVAIAAAIAGIVAYFYFRNGRKKQSGFFT